MNDDQHPVRGAHARAVPGRDSSDPGEPYAAALDWLFAQRRSAPRDPERMRLLLGRLRVQADVPAIHVVGTAGKGTVASMVERGLHAAGEVTGRFTSPHVEDFSERIEVDGRPISPDDVVAFVERVRSTNLDPAPAFFEIALAMALSCFARHGVTTAVVEAGVGARRDATAALARVRATVVTNVGLDHAATLGGTIAAIARDKAGALRARTPLVTAATGVARAVLAAEAARLGVRMHADPPGGALFRVPEELRAGQDPARAQNQALAAAALRVLGAPEHAVAAGVAAPPLPGRREVFRLGTRTVILDGAHNPLGAATLAASLPPGYVLLFGALGRKDGARTLRRLADGARSVVLTEASPGEGFPPAGPALPRISEPLAALRLALASTPAGGTLVVAGSMYLAGRLRPHLRSEAEGEPAVSAPAQP